MLKKLIATGKTIFTSQDIAKIIGITNNQYLATFLSRKVKSGELIRIKKGIYSFTFSFNKLELANKLKHPSYISLEYVLFKENIIFQDYTNIITSVSNNTLSIKIEKTEFRYFKIKDEILSNPEGVLEKDKVVIASLERAICDTLYLRGNIYFDNLKSFNKEFLLSLSRFYNKRVQKEVKKICSI